MKFVLLNLLWLEYALTLQSESKQSETNDIVTK